VSQTVIDVGDSTLNAMNVEMTDLENNTAEMSVESLCICRVIAV